MGITLRDIHKQREMLRRGEEIAQAAEQAATREAERMRLRDQFAAAALTGLMQFRGSPGDAGAAWKSDALVAAEAYQLADAMLSARTKCATH